MKTNITLPYKINPTSLKALLVMFSIIFSGLQLFAQSPKTGRIKINYTAYPSTPLTEGIKSYYVDINNNTEYENITRKTDRSRIKLLGSEKFKYIEDATGADLRIDVELAEASYDTAYTTIVSKKYTTKTEYEETIRWQSILRVMMKTSFTLKEVESDKVLASLVKQDTLATSSKSFATLEEAKAAFEKKEMESVLSKNLYKLFTKTKRPFLKEINDRYGYPRESAVFQIIQGKETTQNYKDLAEAYEQFKGAVSDYNRGRSVDEWYIRAENSLKIWEKAISEYKPNSTKTRINDSNINYLFGAFAAGKFLFEQYEEAQNALDRASTTYKKNSSIKKLYKVIEQQNERASANGLEKPQKKVLTGEDASKLNYLVIHQLFMNYELAEKHQNLQVLPSYFPSFDKREMRQISMTGESAGHQEKVEYIYSTDKLLKKLTYSVDRGSRLVMYNYNLVYSKGRLDGMDIGGKRKVSFEYHENGLIKSIKRTKNGAEFEYVFSPSYAGDAFNIKLFVTNNGQRRPSSRKYFVKWNDSHQLTGFNFDVYSAKGYTYNDQGDVASLSVNTVNASDVKLEWEYEYDGQGYWTSKKFGEEIQLTRTLTY